MRWEWLATIFLLAVEPARGDVDVVYVAVGGSAEVPGSARARDPARIARRLEKSGLSVRLVDLTVPGAPLHKIRQEQLPRAVALRPTLVTVAIGPFDVVGTSLRSFSRDLQIVADLLYRTNARVVIGNLMRAGQLRGGADRSVRRRVEAFNWAIVRIARRHGFLLADVRAGSNGLTWEEAVGRAVDALARPQTPPRTHARDRAAAPAAALKTGDRGAARGLADVEATRSGST